MLNSTIALKINNNEVPSTFFFLVVFRANLWYTLKVREREMKYKIENNIITINIVGKIDSTNHNEAYSEIKEILDGVSLNDPMVMTWFKEYVTNGLKEIKVI